MSTTPMSQWLQPALWQPTLLAACIGVAVVCAVLLVGCQLAQAWPAYRRHFLHGVTRQLQRAHLYVDASRLLTLNIALAGALTLAVLLTTGSVLPACACALACGLLPRLVLWWLRHRRSSALRQQLPDIVMLLAGGLRAGMSLNQSLSQAAAEVSAPFRQELELMLREQRLGASFEAALAGLERRVPLEETLLLCAALRISRHTGGHLAQTLEALADALRRKIALEGKIRSLTAQGRLQGWAMGLLPAVCALALALIEPEAMAMLVTTPLGWVTCAVLLLMQALGIHGLRRIVSIDP
jgi:tight adherence protein B